MDSDRSALLPLRDAMLQWCDQSLVQSAIAADAEFKAAPPDPRGPSWLQGDSLEVVRAWRAAPSPRRTLQQRAELAWQALIDNFRTLVATEAVVLSGLQTKPSLAFERSDVPPVWASQMRFSLTKGRVTVAEVVFADILVRRPSSTPMPHPAELPVPAEADASGSVDSLGVMVALDGADSLDAPPSDDEAPAKARAKPGRKPKTGIVKQVLLSRWESISSEAASAPSGRPNFANLARTVHRHLTRQRPKLDERIIPQEESIRRKLPLIYDELLRETRCGK